MSSHMEIAKGSIAKQSSALRILAKNVPEDLSRVIDYILKLKGRVILIGIGKSNYIAKKIASSLASTGTPAFFIHPSEASHGDLGMITENDMVIMISNSGETKELFDTINYCKRYSVKIAAITMHENSALAQNSDFLLKLPKQKETSSIAAPTTSALMSLSLGDAIVTCLHEARGFSKEDFQLLHPGGKIGTNLLKVSDIMHSGDNLPIAFPHSTLKDTIIIMTKKCLGCAIICDDEQKVIGIITDGDLRRNITDNLNNVCAKDIMTPNPMLIGKEMLATQALNIMNKKTITVLPIATKERNILGIVHIHDILKAGVS